MADPNDLGGLINPSQPAINPNATPEQKQQYEAGWFDILKRPEVIAGLTQAGIQLMQPMPIQQTGAGAFGAALGAGAQAFDRSVTSQSKSADELVKQLREEEQAANVRRGQDITAGGQQLQYGLGLRGLKTKENIAAANTIGRAHVAQILADAKVSAAVKTAVSNYYALNASDPVAMAPENIDKFVQQIQGAGAAPAAPGPATTPVVPQGGLPTIHTQEEYDALPQGAPYIDENGNRATKRH